MPDVLIARTCPKCNARQYQKKGEKFLCKSGCPSPTTKTKPAPKKDEPSEPTTES